MSKRKGLAYAMKQHLKKEYKNAVTRKNYNKHLGRFCDFVKANNITARYAHENATKVLQQYTDHLISKKLCAATIHTYIAFPCQYFDISMKEINKPLRLTENNKKSRGALNTQGDKEKNLPKNKRLVDFQKVVGIRREEITRLRGNNFVYDESGHPCVEVVKGKGGKHHLQRITKKDIEFVESYFDGSEDKIFTAKEMNNKIDLHGIRAEHAREMYHYYVEVCKDPLLYEKLRSQLIARYETCNTNIKKKNLGKFIQEMNGTYKMRGNVAKRARELGRPTEYNKTALLAVSVFHLSHWRNNVTIQHYMI